MEAHRFDGLLMGILQERKTITGFLDAIFGFLSRNTDFYHEQKNSEDRFGFPPGMKEKIVLKVLQKFNPKSSLLTEQLDVPPAIEEIEVVATENPDTPPKEKITREADVEPGVENIPQTSKEAVREFFASNECHNGARFDEYCWSQTSTEVEIHIRLPNNVKLSKHLNTQIEADHIKVTSTVEPEAPVIFDGKLSAKCKHNDVLWTISDGKLQITLDKMKEGWWERLIEGEQPIDVSKIDCTTDIDDLSPDCQAAVDKVRWEQHQKELQKPTEEDKQNIERLREAWDAEGSPFKGTPFDPSMVKFN